jgi:hypothetical protein
VDEVTVVNIKLYYLFLLQKIPSTEWNSLYHTLQKNQKSIYHNLPVKKQTIHSHSGLLLTTEHAHTLTDGPTIYITDEVHKIQQFLYENSHISPIILQNILDKITENKTTSKKIIQLTKSLNDKVGEQDKKITKEIYNSDIKTLLETIDTLKLSMHTVSLPSVYLPNSIDHQHKWLSKQIQHAFIALMDEYTVITVMEMDIDIQLKILLLMGIGIFDSTNSAYIHLIQSLACQQKLFIIIASSDYIYGTNYQFCHGYMGKNVQMTQEKIIQAFGRIGRGNIQQEYTIRLRSDDIIQTLLLPNTNKRESYNMCQLFSHEEKKEES